MKTDKVYVGYRRLGSNGMEPVVLVVQCVVDKFTLKFEAKGKPLPHVVRHSPTGFEWGYGGSGPADLAYSILADACAELPEETRDWLYFAYQEFKRQYVAGWGRAWAITWDEVASWFTHEIERQKEVEDGQE